MKTKVTFDEVNDLFYSFRVWNSNRPTYWYRLAWKALESDGLTVYRNVLEKSLVYGKAFVLVRMYGVFSQLAWGEKFYSDYYELDNYFSPLILTEVCGLNSVYEYENLSFDEQRSFFKDFLDTLKDEVFISLLKNIGHGSHSRLFTSLHLSACRIQHEVLDEVDEDGNEYYDTEDFEFQDYDDFVAGIDTFSGELHNYEIDSCRQVAFYWISQGMGNL